MKIKKILFPTDFSECADHALDEAVQLAGVYGAELHLIHAVVLHADVVYELGTMPPNVEEIRRDLEATARDRLDRLVAGPSTDLRITRVQKRGFSAASVILTYAAEQDIDLIVMGTHGHRGLSHLFLGSIAEQVVREAACPVMTIREKASAPGPAHLKKILVPVDFSEHAREALRYARHIASQYHSELTILHVIERTIHPAFYIADFAPELKKKTTDALDALVGETELPGVPQKVLVREGSAARDIVEIAAEENIDLIIIATHGLSGIRHFLLGSVTEKVVRSAPCPVFTVKVHGKTLF